MRMRLLIAALVCLGSACSAPAPAAKDVQLSYAEKQTMCANCCEFEARFRAGGLVTFIGRKACPVPGEQHFRIAAAEFDELVRAFDKVNFFDMPRTGARIVADAGVVTVTYRDSRRIHETLDDGQHPKELRQLEARLRRAARADEYLRPSLARYEALVAAGWDANTLDDSHDNALVSTITEGDLASTRFLLSKGARLSEEAARLAAGRPEPEFVVLAMNASKTTPGRSLGPLLLDAARGSVSTTRVLLDARADPDWRQPNGRTALMNAISGGSLEAAALLLKHGASLETRDDQGRTAMAHAASAMNTGFITLLAARGADVNARDRSGRTPLMIASDGCYEWNVPPLLAAGADPALADPKGRTALQPMLSVVGDPKCARTLRLIERAVARPR